MGEGEVRVHPDIMGLVATRITEDGKVCERNIRERMKKMPGSCWKNRSLLRKNSEMEVQTNVGIICTDVTTKVTTLDEIFN